MEQTDQFREITVAELNVASERIEQFQRFLKLVIAEDPNASLVPSDTTVIFRAITVEGEPYQLVTFRPQEDMEALWSAQITIGNQSLDWMREMDADLPAAATAEAALDNLERRIRIALAKTPVLAAF